jgi:hypothetical protein
VVPAAARPRLVVLSGSGLGVGAGRAAQGVRGQEARAAVRVLEGIHEHDRLAPHEVGPGVTLRGEEVVDERERRVGRRDFVAVDGVEEPHDGRELAHEAVGLGGRERARVGERTQLPLNVVESREALRAAQDQHAQGPALLAPRVLDHARPIGRRRRECCEVRPDLVGARELLAQLVACHLLQGRNAGIVPGFRADRRGHGERSGESQGGDHGVSFDVFLEPVAVQPLQQGGPDLVFDADCREMAAQRIAQYLPVVIPGRRVQYDKSFHGIQ